jgi:hypothetical protein
MNLQSRNAIEALRAGVPNRAAVRLMGTEESGIEAAFDTLLGSIWQPDVPAQPGIGIAGGFGSGKSHFLGYLAEVALGQNFAVSRVVISKETPLADPGRVFEAAIRAAELPNRNDDSVVAALAILRDAPDKADALERVVREPDAGFASIFSAILYLVRRSSTAPETIRLCERFLSGARITAASIRLALSAAGTGRLFDTKMPSPPELANQRIRFVSCLFREVGFAGWCILLDEVELIGRYTPWQRALSYAWLSSWLGLPGASHFSGIAVVYAITDDFVSAVIDYRQDSEKLPERLALKGRSQETPLALAAIRHLEKTVSRHRLRTPGQEELARACLRLGRIYSEAHDWPAPPLSLGERTATRTMRHYIKSWITQWDLQRLTDHRVEIVEETMVTTYDEDATLAESLSVPDEDA